MVTHSSHHERLDKERSCFGTRTPAMSSAFSQLLCLGLRQMDNETAVDCTSNGIVVRLQQPETFERKFWIGVYSCAIASW